MTHFGDRLRSVVDAHGRLCLGIDPHDSLLLQWGLEVDAAGARELSLRALEAAHGRVGIVKPQVAFFERFGAAGYTVLEEVIRTARGEGLLVIADVKRGDIGSTAAAYGEAWLSPSSPLEADAMTAVAYQGLGSLDPVIELAIEHGKGVFVLTATSNPEGRGVQQSVGDSGRSVAGQLARDVAVRNASARGWGSLGVVIGATEPIASSGIDPVLLQHTPVLGPGFGHQGTRLAQLRDVYGVAESSVIPTVTRSVLSAGPDGVAAALDAHRSELESA
ncbi:MAG: orotidine-5'-phosphate decarboxylase [Microcella sp.]|uniref:orotidine-5'-phosphate decarboxylase n=1 Tax=Microcella sp. TaxID=1913979 RepID=UPI0024CDFD4F|nr:orotidine-5'-phosphate decarboxylase [Microcella sp.]UYN84213.1 MAG: orotidine-5'-phosphate decarboxylase [Microcella sp.]